jgi:hypothetical protein
MLLARARETARKQKRLYARGVARELTAKQLQSLRERILRFGERVTATAAAADAIAPRAISPVETS